MVCDIADGTGDTARTGVRKDGTGTWTLGGDLTFTGPIEVESGMLKVRNTSRFTWFKFNICEVMENCARYRGTSAKTTGYTVQLGEVGLFDKDGNMKDWWTEEDSRAFMAKADKLAAQFDSIEVLPGINANGRFTLGENIADQGGLGVAYSALQNSFGGNHPADIDGLSAEQRFFIGYAHVWAGNITEEEMARRTKMDEHSLSVNRVNATLRNFGIFFDAFGIGEGEQMWRPEEERVMIW